VASSDVLWPANNLYCNSPTEYCHEYHIAWGNFVAVRTISFDRLATMQVTKRRVFEVILEKLELYVLFWCMLILTASFGEFRELQDFRVIIAMIHRKLLFFFFNTVTFK
jgi:hypothetical protein